MTTITDRTRGRGGGGGAKMIEGMWLDRCIPGLVGELKEERQLMMRKVTFANYAMCTQNIACIVESCHIHVWGRLQNYFTLDS